MPKRSNEFQRLVAMLTMLKSDGATVHESVEVMEIASQERREVDVVAFGKVAGHQSAVFIECRDWKRCSSRPRRGLHSAAEHGHADPAVPPPARGIVGQHIAFHHRDGPEEIGQHPRGEQPAHVRPKNNRTRTQFRHDETPNPLRKPLGAGTHFGHGSAGVAQRFFVRCEKPEEPATVADTQRVLRRQPARRDR